MMDINLFLIFLVTTLVVVFSPGAATIFVATQGATNGTARAFSAVSGIAAGNVVYFCLSASGIAALLIASNLVFSVIKWAGVAYLIYLGLSAIFSKSGGIRVKAGQKKSSLKKLFLSGFLIELANPKALLYFSALLPQFMDMSQPLLPQLLIMGGVTVLIDLTAYSIYAHLGDRITRGGIKDWVVSLVNKTAGAALLFTGFKMASINANR